MSNDEKKIYRVLKEGIYGFAHINDPVYGCEKDRVVTTDEGNPKIVPQKGENDKIISFFYHTYKGEGARKIQRRIKRFYTGISIKRIQKWLNSNENHFKTNPIFSNKPPLSPVVSKTVQGFNQIDLVDMRSMSVAKDGVEYNYILSLLDVFSRFLELRPLSNKDSNEVLMHLRAYLGNQLLRYGFNNESLVLMILLTLTSKAHQYSSQKLCSAGLKIFFKCV